MTHAALTLIFTALAVALLSTLITWLLLRHRHQAEQHSLSSQLAERTRQYQFAAREQAEAESALAALQQQFQTAQTALAAAETRSSQIEPLQNELAQSRRHVQDLQVEMQEIHSRFAAAKQHIEGLQARESELGRLKEEYARLQQTAADLNVRNERLHTQIEQERLASEEKLALLAEARQSLTDQFQNLANNILEEKTKRFTEHNTENINRLLTPLNERMGKFSELVQSTYEKEAKERLTL